MKRNGEPPPEKGMELEPFVEKWKYELFGKLINGLSFNDSAMRARYICNLPAVLETMLRAMHHDVRGEVSDLPNGKRG